MSLIAGNSRQQYRTHVCPPLTHTRTHRCIQSTVYEEGSVLDADNGGAKYKSKKVADKDRNVFLTSHGRQVKDGGGVEVDYKVEPQKASPLEVILINSGAYSDYAAEWSKNHLLTDKFKVDDATYKDFQRFVEQRQREGDIKLEVVYESQLKELQKKLKASKFDSARRELDTLRADIIKDIKKDFSVYKVSSMLLTLHACTQTQKPLSNEIFTPTSRPK